VIMLVAGVGMLAFRDPNGIRPLVFGFRQGENGKSMCVMSSESVAIDALGLTLTRDVRPGEAVLVDFNGKVHSQLCYPSAKLRPCIFEYVYFARPDSIMDSVPVYESRLRMGDKLALKIMRERPDHGIDVVIPIPDTSRASALQCAYTLGCPFREGFIKNRYIARTFIMPGQAARRKSVRLKLNTIKSEFAGKNVLLVDDSIVRGTTAREIVAMAREAGPKNVFLVSAAPQIKFPNVYGIDIPTRTELVAHNRSVDEIAKSLGVDWLVYQDLEDLEESVRSLNPAIDGFESSCFSGKYVTPEIDSNYLNALEASRTPAEKKAPGYACDDGDDAKKRAAPEGASSGNCESISNGVKRSKSDAEDM
jgi:amidophosphoribosyltransferase